MKKCIIEDEKKWRKINALTRCTLVLSLLMLDRFYQNFQFLKIKFNRTRFDDSVFVTMIFGVLFENDMENQVQRC